MYGKYRSTLHRCIFCNIVYMYCGTRDTVYGSCINTFIVNQKTDIELPTVYRFLGAKQRRSVCDLRPLRGCCSASAWHGFGR